MEVVISLAIGVMAGAGVWLVLRPRTFQVPFGSSGASSMSTRGSFSSRPPT